MVLLLFTQRSTGTSCMSAKPHSGSSYMELRRPISQLVEPAGPPSCYHQSKGNVKPMRLALADASAGKAKSLRRWYVIMMASQSPAVSSPIAAVGCLMVSVFAANCRINSSVLASLFKAIFHPSLRYSQFMVLVLCFPHRRALPLPLSPSFSWSLLTAQELPGQPCRLHWQHHQTGTATGPQS